MLTCVLSVQETFEQKGRSVRITHLCGRSGELLVHWKTLLPMKMFLEESSYICLEPLYFCCAHTLSLFLFTPTPLNNQSQKTGKKIHEKQDGHVWSRCTNTNRQNIQPLNTHCVSCVAFLCYGLHWCLPLCLPLQTVLDPDSGEWSSLMKLTTFSCAIHWP